MHTKLNTTHNKITLWDTTDDIKEVYMDHIIKTGEKPGSGTYVCTNCSQHITVDEYDNIPPCPRCTNNEFVRE
ncbi:MAG: hypothetical protein IKD35_03830 [Clostridia bacterium]|nr:hypothetical protein [Clostridia bacterium]